MDTNDRNDPARRIETPPQRVDTWLQDIWMPLNLAPLNTSLHAYSTINGDQVDRFGEYLFPRRSHALSDTDTDRPSSLKRVEQRRRSGQSTPEWSVCSKVALSDDPAGIVRPSSMERIKERQLRGLSLSGSPHLQPITQPMPTDGSVDAAESGKVARKRKRLGKSYRLRLRRARERKLLEEQANDVSNEPANDVSGEPAEIRQYMPPEPQNAQFTPGITPDLWEQQANDASSEPAQILKSTPPKRRTADATPKTELDLLEQRANEVSSEPAKTRQSTPIKSQNADVSLEIAPDLWEQQAANEVCSEPSKTQEPMTPKRSATRVTPENESKVALAEDDQLSFVSPSPVVESPKEILDRLDLVYSSGSSDHERRPEAFLEQLKRSRPVYPMNRGVKRSSNSVSVDVKPGKSLFHALRDSKKISPIVFKPTHEEKEVEKQPEKQSRATENTDTRASDTPEKQRGLALSQMFAIIFGCALYCTLWSLLSNLYTPVSAMRVILAMITGWMFGISISATMNYLLLWGTSDILDGNNVGKPDHLGT